MENSILISPRGARSWEAQSTPRELGNQAEDSFLLSHFLLSLPQLHIRDPEINWREQQPPWALPGREPD